jgi:hypothetical protein
MLGRIIWLIWDCPSGMKWGHNHGGIK